PRRGRPGPAVPGQLPAARPGTRRGELLGHDRADQLLRRHRGGGRVHAHHRRAARADAPRPRGRPLMAVFPFLVVAWIVTAGLYGLVTSRDLIHLIVCLIVVQSSTYVLLLGVGYITGAVAPYFFDVPNHTPAVDPVVQALGPLLRGR